ncbi:MAG: PEP-utilizing enzyme [bacterium]
MSEKRFPKSYEVKTPEGAEGWEEMYPYYLLFSDQRREFEDRFWFCDTMHWTTPLYPFDTFTAEIAISSLGQYNTRVFMVPPALGIDIRVLNGYVYLSPIPVDNPKEIEERVKDFTERAGFYYQNWESLYAKWKEKVTVEIEGLKKIEIPDLPEKEDIAIVSNAVGISTGFRLQEAYNRLLESMSRIWSFHFEFLNLGYAAFLDFSIFMKKVFPDISDQTITQMVAGIDVLLFRPDTELRNLAKLAVSLGVSDIFLASSGIDEIVNLEDESLRNLAKPATSLGVSGNYQSNSWIDEILVILQKTPAGKKWLEALEKAKDPWFYFSSGTGFYHLPRSWIDDLSVPFSAIKGYIKKLETGESIERQQEEIRREAERLSNGYYELLRTGEEKKAFLEKLSLAKTVFPYVEEHNFYVEHWHHTIFWNKMRQLGGVFVKNGFFCDEEDIFYLNRYEVSAALYDLCSSWAIGSLARGPLYWPEKIAKRRGIISALAKYQPGPALGTPPEKITEPFTIMLWGVVSEKIDAWLEASTEAKIQGHPASPGIVEGRAKVVLSVDDLDTIEEGDIMVCPITTPSWTPIFGKLSGIVTNTGGIMSHAAIVCREYGMPAVVGTGIATQLIKTGQFIRVDGGKGTVEVVTL